MSKTILDLQLKLRKAWLKLLKAEAKRKQEKAAKWEMKVIELELQIRNMQQASVMKDVVYSDKATNTWTVKLEEDGDDVVLPLPQEVLDHLDLREGDVLKWIDNGNGSWSLTKSQYDSDSGLTESL